VTLAAPSRASPLPQVYVLITKWWNNTNLCGSRLAGDGDLTGAGDYWARFEGLCPTANPARIAASAAW
jgi:hypothetical protein